MAPLPLGMLKRLSFFGGVLVKVLRGLCSSELPINSPVTACARTSAQIAVLIFRTRVGWRQLAYD